MVKIIGVDLKLREEIGPICRIFVEFEVIFLDQMLAIKCQPDAKISEGTILE